MIKVFFESRVHAEKVATFEDEEIFMACLPALEGLASMKNMKVTEVVTQN